MIEKRRVGIITNDYIFSGISNSLSLRDLVEKPDISHDYIKSSLLKGRDSLTNFSLNSGVLVYNRNNAEIDFYEDISIFKNEVLAIYGISSNYKPDMQEVEKSKRKMGLKNLIKDINIEFNFGSFKICGTTQLKNEEYGINPQNKLHLTKFEREYIIIQNSKISSLEKINQFENPKNFFILGDNSLPILKEGEVIKDRNINYCNYFQFSEPITLVSTDKIKYCYLF